MYPQQPYPPQMPMVPQGYPIQPSYPAPMAPPGYGQPYGQPAPAAPPAPAGTIDQFFSQPTGGAPSFKFMDTNRQPLIGRAYGGYVSRPIQDGDIRAQTNDAGAVSTYRDGRAKFAMIVPLTVAQGSPEFPEGQASWWVKGQARDELARAMAEAGAPQGTPEMGAFIWVQLTGTRAIQGRNPQFLYRVVYVRPGGQVDPQLMILPPPIGPAAPPAPQAYPQAYAPQQMPGYTVPQAYGAPQPQAQQVAPQPPAQYPPAPPQAAQVAAAPVQVAPQPPAPQQVPPQPPVAQVAPAAPGGVPAGMQMPPGLDAEQQALWARLSGAQQQ